MDPPCFRRRPRPSRMTHPEPVCDSGSGKDPEPRALVEAALFQHREPLTAARLARVLGETPEVVVQLLGSLAREYDSTAHGLTIRQVAGGYLLLAKPFCLER